MNLLEKVKETIEREGLIPAESIVIVGISGGADSVALLHILNRLGYSIKAAHLNHSIRGAEADADEAFVNDLCKKLGIECFTAKTNVPALAGENGLSLEMAARQARHDFFLSTVQSLKSKAFVALAHHADDQLETFFLRAARGTGPAGLGGMRFFQTLEPNADAMKTSRIHFIRPMLDVRRLEILDWLQAEHLTWREDTSNSDESIPRNFVRHQLLPNLSQLNDRAAENILRTMQILRDEEDHPEAAAVRRAARDQLIEFGVNPTFDAVEQFIEFSARTDGTTALDLEGVRLVNEYGALRVESVGRAVPSEPKTVKMEKGLGILRDPWKASVSLEKIAGRDVIVRAPQPGDRMNPYGMNGSKKLQDIFTDLKIPKAQRADWPVVECAGEIIWIPGYRIARGWELSSDSEAALHLSV